MRILPFVNLNINRSVNYNSQVRPSSGHYEYGMPRLNVLDRDTVSFSAASRPLNQVLLETPDDAFPCKNLAYILKNEAEKSSENIDIFNIHKQYYSRLHDCKSLDEAKELYPELKDIYDASEIDTSSLYPHSVFLKIENGIKDGVDLSNLSLEVLKMCYADLATTKIVSDEFALGGTGYKTLMNKLNIRFDPRYTKLLVGYKHASDLSNRWEDEEYRAKMLKYMSETMKERWKDPEFRELKSRQAREQFSSDEAKKIFLERMEAGKERFKQNPRYFEILSERSKKTWSSPEARAVQSEKIKKYRIEHPEMVERLQMVYKAKSEACKRHPEFTKVRRKIAQESSQGLWTAFSKLRAGKKLNDIDVRCLHSYYKKCNEAIPGYAKVIGETQKEILREWGFYDDDNADKSNVS